MLHGRARSHDVELDAGGNAAPMQDGSCGYEVGGAGVGAAHEVCLLNADVAPLEVREWHQDFDAVVWA